MISHSQSLIGGGIEFMVIDQDKRIPKYIQIYDWLHGMIKRGKIEIGDKIPTENELSEMFDTNRMTVRQALDKLVGEGMIVRQRGRGTFLILDKPKNFIYSLETTSSFSDDMRRCGVEPICKTRKMEVIEANEEVSALLNLNKDRRVILTLRVFFADKEPVMVGKSYLPYSEFKDILDMQLTNGRYRVFIEKFNIPVHHADQTFSAVLSGEEETKLFGVSCPIPCIYLEWVLYDKNNIPIEVAYCHYRGDRFKFNIHSGQYVYQK